jgi:hypothetical protein
MLNSAPSLDLCHYIIALQQALCHNIELTYSSSFFAGGATCHAFALVWLSNVKAVLHRALTAAVTRCFPLRCNLVCYLAKYDVCVTTPGPIMMDPDIHQPISYASMVTHTHTQAVFSSQEPVADRACVVDVSLLSLMDAVYGSGFYHPSVRTEVLLPQGRLH